MDISNQPDTITNYQDPFTLELSEPTMIEVINERIKNSKEYYERMGYPKRRKRNKSFYLGEQWERPRKEYESDYVDNLIYESENTIKPIALSILPDLMVKPGNEGKESKDLASSMSDVTNSDLRKRENRRVLGLAFKHVPIFYQGVVKCIWDPREGENGDYRFVVVHPENIIVDHTATTNNPDDMSFIAEYREITIKEAIMMFPKKKDELISHLVATGRLGKNDNRDSRLASTIKITEVWFDWYEQKEDPETGERKWSEVSGVVWKYGEFILGKMKNPYWDWQGETRLFKLEMGEKKEPTEEELMASVIGELELETQKVFRNYFKTPRKPYIFLNYDMLGESPLDATSRIEQAIPLQKDVNKRGAQISEMNDRARGKFVFNAKAISKETVAALDLNDPDQDIMVDDKVDVSRAYAFLQSPPAPAPLYTEQENERQKAFSKMGTNATTRGVREGTETATARQLFKESDFGRIDDIVEETINSASEEMARWAMQMIRLFYTEGHMRRLLGKDGDVSFQKITSDSVEDGQEIIVSASGVDKMQTKREAMEMAGMQLIDPLTFFIDMGMDNPKDRAKKLLLFMSSPELYMQNYIEDRDTQGMADQLAQQGEPQPDQQLPVGGGGNWGTILQNYGRRML